MPQATVRTTVVVDLDEFETDDLLDEIESRYSNHKDWILINDKIKELTSINMDQEPLPDNLISEMKLELIKANFDKFSIEELEQFFKSK
jgi:hypothetical protein